MKEEIKALEYANEITKALKEGGILLTTKLGDKVNAMTIGWGMIGRVWEKECFFVFVREGRFTREILDKTKEFTISVPYGDFDKKILGYCGQRSGRNVDKFKDLGLSLEEGKMVKSPAIKELPLTLECKVLYSKLQDKSLVPDEIKPTLYPEDVDSTNPRANRDYHVVYYGEIVSAYIVK